jgi:hypothetical protein
MPDPGPFTVHTLAGETWLDFARVVEAADGGEVEGRPEHTEGRNLSGSFLWNGTMPMSDRLGFERVGQPGKFKWLVRPAVAPAPVPA